MAFGLKNAPVTFQLPTQRILAGYEEFALPYIDDIIVYSTSFTDHLTHINTTLQRLANNGLTVKSSKCSWCYTAFEFLGFIVGKGGIAIPQARVEYMAKYKIPKTKQQMKAFLGLVNFYSKFIPSFAQHTSKLSQLTM